MIGIKSNIAVLDVETGGLDPRQAVMTEVAVVILDPITLNELGRYEALIAPYNIAGVTPVYDSKAMEYTNKTVQQLRDEGRPHAIVVHELIELFRLHKVSNRLWPMLVGHNVHFDISFLRALFAERKQVFDDYHGGSYLDTLAVEKFLLAAQALVNPNFSLSLENLAKFHGLEQVTAHAAMADVETTANLLRLIYKAFSSNTKPVAAVTATSTSDLYAERQKDFYL